MLRLFFCLKTHVISKAKELFVTHFKKPLWNIAGTNLMEGNQ